MPTKTLYLVPAFIAIEATSIDDAETLALDFQYAANRLQTIDSILYLDEELQTIDTGESAQFYEPHTVNPR